MAFGVASDDLSEGVTFFQDYRRVRWIRMLVDVRHGETSKPAYIHTAYELRRCHVAYCVELLGVRLS